MKNILFFLLILSTYEVFAQHNKVDVVVWKFELLGVIENNKIQTKLRRGIEKVLNDDYKLKYVESWIKSKKVGYSPIEIISIARQIQVILGLNRQAIKNNISAHNYKVAEEYSKAIRYAFKVAVIGDVTYQSYKAKYEVYYNFVNLESLSNDNPIRNGVNLPSGYVAFNEQEITSIDTITKKFKEEFKKRKMIGFQKKK